MTEVNPVMGGHVCVPSPIAPSSGQPANKYLGSQDINLSLSFFSSVAVDDQAPRYDLLMRCVELADREGLHAVWLPERHFGDFGELFPNPSVVAAAISGRTRQIGIRAGSVVAPLHDPLRLVEEWSVVDNLSGGRVGISFASGWNPDDFVLSPDSFEARRSITSEVIDTVRLLWSGESIRRRNGTGAWVDVFSRPRPLCKHLPTWLTVVRADGFIRAAQMGVNVLTGMMELKEAELAVAIRNYRAEHPKPAESHVTLLLHTYIDPTHGRAADLARGPLARYLGSHLKSGESAMATNGDLSNVIGTVNNTDKDAILMHMARRYIANRSMIGTPAEAVSVCQRLAAAGVDEIACLVDFGLTPDHVLAGMEQLLRVRDTLALGRSDR
ncbi:MULTISPECIES: MupA/Atu3671 family FMN-dependent luciferase-like monooxygenase [Pseudomonas]|uniref:LuxA protein n=2 Tax=Pseudomonas TaxID=286 RepID=A0A0D0TKZ3_PSEFL|nr:MULTISPECIES: MupA/Atu3671 family FMN-dependent luciferase-like monooxygenase [Pseudomonas fluorescens group]AZE63488.1 Non-ribosomal peptide synthetase [Pseudomonas synxantha]KIR22674.1 Alkanal monooxygenase alpha chain [Pseudomonas fluorescens]